MAYQQVPGEASKPVNWKHTLVPSNPSMVVYAYDEESNKYLPYKIEDARLGSDYPSKEIDKVFDDIHANTQPPPKVRRVLIGRLL